MDYAFSVTREIDEQPWLALIEQAADATFWHRRDWLRYTMAYTGGTDWSFGMRTLDGTLLAIQPLHVMPDGRVQFGAHPTPHLLIAPTAQEWQRAALLDVAWRHIRATALSQGWREFFYAQALSQTPSELTIDGDDPTEVAQFRTRMIDLTQPIEALWSQVRDSYRPLITRARKMTEILTGESLFPTYLALHRDQAIARGGKPRAPETYAMQQEWLRSGLGRLYGTAYEGRVQSCAYWIIDRNWAYYASGVSQQDNLQAATIWHSLADLKAHGIARAEIGWQGVGRTAKEQQIEFFKRGFGGTDWHVHAVRTVFVTHNQGGAA